MATDPYAAPRARVADVPSAAPDGNFIPDGQAVAAGNGWQWLLDAWELFKRQPGMWIALAVVFIVVVTLINLVPLVGSLAAALLGPVFAGGIMAGCQAVRGDGALEIGHLFAGFKANTGKLALIGVFNLLAWIVIFLVIMVIVGAGAFALMMGGGNPSAATAVGSAMSLMLGILLALALSVPVYMALWFAPALVMLNDFEPIPALKTSFGACLKNIVPFLLYGVILFAAAIVASIPFALGWLVLGPVLAISVYTGYRDIFYAG
ncbi:MAG: BPSS1780 family membrane protein [Burkholderiales bacterium]